MGILPNSCHLAIRPITHAIKIIWFYLLTEGGQVDPQNVKMETPNIKTKPGELTEEIDRRLNRHYREKLGPFGSLSGGLKNQRRAPTSSKG